MTERKRDRLLNPIDRISEILFGLMMAVTIVGSVSIATGGHQRAHEATLAALGCNLAWGMVDALMYLLRTVTERSHIRRIAHKVVSADRVSAHKLILGSLPDYIAAITGPDEIEGMRVRLLALPRKTVHMLNMTDLIAAVAIFLLVVIATFPVVLPFILLENTRLAFHVSRGTAVVMLFIAGVILGRYGGHDHPARTGFAVSVVGVAVIGGIMALGG
ncbi:conserved membrane hypothetical protein [Paraburkholderia caribensis]|uniref:VIT1/CCC1 transporter family protein n=1 Tax=Paraburkholderia caribensis TaxID=75105 RepID=UPI001CB4843D|nr:VIT1/CCC1 transporter family protein [Paraburkholderia caribensis]CAG9219372.1 conserved membrane hypothetical protein [Paraburkholderia caribensis]